MRLWFYLSIGAVMPLSRIPRPKFRVKTAALSAPDDADFAPS